MVARVVHSQITSYLASNSLFYLQSGWDSIDFILGKLIFPASLLTDVFGAFELVPINIDISF